MGKLADQNRFWSAICQNWSENGRWPIVISSPVLFSQVVVNNSCSELWEVHGFCYKCINTGAHCLLSIIFKRRQNRY